MKSIFADLDAIPDHAVFTFSELSEPIDSPTRRFGTRICRRTLEDARAQGRIRVIPRRPTAVLGQHLKDYLLDPRSTKRGAEWQIRKPETGE